jgi:hypothetical protein
MSLHSHVCGWWETRILARRLHGIATPNDTKLWTPRLLYHFSKEQVEAGAQSKQGRKGKESDMDKAGGGVAQTASMPTASPLLLALH